MSKQWPTLRVLLTAHLTFTLIVWLVILVGTLALPLVLGFWWDVDRSIWHYVAGQAPRWLALGLGMDAISTYLRLHIAHGRTRRDFLRQLVPYVAVLAGLMALLVTLGYQIERGVYAVTGWPHRVENEMWFGDTGNVLGILGSFALALLVWTTAGVFLTSAFNRNVLLGLVSIPFGLLLIAPSEALLGFYWVPFVERLHFPPVASLWLSLGGLALAGVAVWGIVRDIPMRPRVA